MSNVVRLQFRPTIIVFVGETGRRICAYLVALCELLPSELHGGVGLIEVDDEMRQARSILLPQAEAVVLEEGEPHEALRTALRMVQSDRKVRSIQGAGYAVPDPHVQIYVVGHTTAQAFPQVMRVIRNELADTSPIPVVSNLHAANIGGTIHNERKDTRLAAHISYLLTDMPPNPNGVAKSSWHEHLVPSEGEMSDANFCFLYEEIGHRDTFHSQADIEYAAAQALFGLLATGLPAAPLVTHATQKRLGVTDATQQALGVTAVDQRIGSLGTSLIRFPRATAERYCTDLLGAELMRNWTESSAAIGEAQLEEPRARAIEDMETIYQQLTDQEDRPGADGDAWPSLSFLSDARLAANLEKRTGELLAVFDYDHVMDDCERTGEQWRAVAQRREGAASIAFHVWEQVARKAWLAAGDEIEQRIGKEIDELWLHEDKGAPYAQAYIERVGEGLHLLRERLVAWRITHTNQYERDLAEVEQRLDGPWLDDAESPAPPAPITMASTGSLPGSRPSSREQRVLNRLERRVAWAEARVPPVLNLIAICVMAIPPVVLVALDALPQSLGLQAPVIVLATLLVTALSALACWLVRRTAVRRCVEARDDLLRVYRRYFTYRCERREDELRVVMLGPFYRRMERVRERLEHMQTFVGSVREHLEEDAARTCRELFDGPGGNRDIYVANGERLTKSGDYTLDDVYAELSRRRQTTPREERAWHRSPDQMIAHLRQSLHQRQTSVLDMPDAEFENAIREFARDIIRTYLDGDFVDLRHALAARGERRKAIWHEALSRSHVLFRPHTSPQPAVLVCGRDEHRAALESVAPHHGAVMVRTQHPDWLLVAQFCPGGALTKWSSAQPDVQEAKQERDVQQDQEQDESWVSARDASGIAALQGLNGHSGSSGSNGSSGRNGNARESWQPDARTISGAAPPQGGYGRA